jgi:hypothetical protein
MRGDSPKVLLMRPQDAVCLPRAKDVSAVTNRMNHDRLFTVKDLVEDAVVTHAEFIESCEVICQRRAPYGLLVLGQPTDSLDNALANRPVQARQLADCGLEDANPIHGSYSNPSCRTTSSSGAPRSPAETACCWRRSLSRTAFLIGNPSSGSPSNSSNLRSTEASIISLSSPFVICATVAVIPPPALSLLSCPDDSTLYCAAQLDAAYERLYVAAQWLSIECETTLETHLDALNARKGGAALSSGLMASLPRSCSLI